MKILIQLAVTVVVTWFLGYMIGAFVYWDLNAGNWPLEGRRVLAGVIGLATCLAAMAIIADKNEHNF